jgi:cardiolipin synthase
MSFATIITLLVVLAGYLILCLFVLHIILSRKSAPASWAWIFLILLVPYLGAFLYVLLGHDSLKRPRLQKRRQQVSEIRPQLDERLKLESPVRVSPGQIDEQSLAGRQLSEQARAALIEASRLARLLPTQCNRVTFIPSGKQTFAEIEAATKRAEHHLHLEFYIFHDDTTGKTILDALTAAAKRGVEVRLLLDYVGCWKTPDTFFAPLRSAGGEVAYFLPVQFFLSPTRAHLRNHRKFVIVDGKEALTGGVNVGDEYQGEWADRRVWADVFSRIKGPAALDLQEVFLEDWLTATGENLSEVDAFFPTEHLPNMESQDDAVQVSIDGDDSDASCPIDNDIVQVLSSGPDEATRPIHDILFASVVSARERAWLTTPYFIPTEPLLEAFKYAARRGTDVRLLCPGKLTNHPMVFYAGRWYYKELLEAGVRIFEFQPGLVHAKLTTIDGEWGSIGSANMDVRSFHLNFELNALIFSDEFASEVEDWFLEHLEQSREVSLEEVESRSLKYRLIEGLSRLLAPWL